VNDASGNITVGNNITVTGTLTGSTGVMNIGSGQIYKDSSGNVGIGTSSPGVKLDVSGQRIRINNASDPGLELWNGSLAKGYVFYDTTNDLVTMRHASTGTGASIDSSGRLLVGQTAAGLGQRFSVTSTGTWNTFFYIPNGQNTIGVTNTSGTASYGAYTFYNNGTSYSFCGNITVSGSSTAYNTSSDYRMKHDVQPITSGLATVSALNPVTYKWNVDGSLGEGFVAHELQEIIPLAVSGNKDAVDSDGKPIYQAVDYSKIVVHLVAAVQEQQAQIEELKARVAALEAK
jgi:hypothetical protein